MSKTRIKIQKATDHLPPYQNYYLNNTFKTWGWK